MGQGKGHAKVTLGDVCFTGNQVQKKRHFPEPEISGDMGPGTRTGGPFLSPFRDRCPPLLRHPEKRQHTLNGGGTSEWSRPRVQ